MVKVCGLDETVHSEIKKMRSEVQNANAALHKEVKFLWDAKELSSLSTSVRRFVGCSDDFLNPNHLEERIW